MPPVKGKSSIFGSLAGTLDTAVRQHANDETDYGFQKLPGGITNGIARLVECTFGNYKSGANQGKPYFRAAGVVVAPTDVALPNKTTQRVKGLQTSIMIPLCDMKNRAGDVTTANDFMGKVLNEMRKLGGPNYTDGATIDNLPGLAEALKQARPYFRFSTSQAEPTEQYPDPRVWENWSGSKGLENYVEEEENAIEDNTATVEATVTAPSKVTPSKPAANGAATKKPGRKEQLTQAFNEFEDTTPAEKVPVPEEALAIDYQALGKKADAENEEAQDMLTELAKAAGWSKKQIADAKDWTAIAKQLQAQATTEEEEEPEEEEEEEGEEEAAIFKPQPEQVFCYRPKGKDGRPGRPVACEVLAVNEKAQTVDLKNTVDQKTIYRAVPWDRLEDAS